MKKRIIVFAVLAAILTALLLSACKKTNSQTVSAYGVVHQQYAGMVTMTVSYSGGTYKVDDVKIKEYLPISEIGKVKTTTSGTGEDQIITYTIHGLTLSEQEIAADFTLSGSTYYANKVKVGDKIFTLTKMDNISGSPDVYQNSEYSNGTNYALYPAGSLPEGVKNSYENVEFTKWYIEKLTASDFHILKGESGDTYDVPFTVYGTKTVTKAQWADKEFNGYWMSGGVGQGWLTNIAKMETAIKSYGLDVYTGNEVKGEGGYLLGTNITGATLNDYHQYMGIAKKAYDDAKAKF